MSDEYLWDKSGTPDPDELFLERILPRLRERVTRRAAPEPFPEAARARRSSGAVVLAAGALAAGLLLGVGAGAWLWRGSGPRSAATAIAGEPERAAAGAASERAPERPAATSATPAEQPRPRTPAPVVEKPAASPSSAQAIAPAPSASVTASAARAAADAPRTQKEIQHVVAGHAAELRQRCWEPALAKRKDGAPSTVKLGLSFTVEPNGSVRSVRASSDPQGYPGLAGCLVREISAWKFPAASDSTAVQVPFVFAEGG